MHEPYISRAFVTAELYQRRESGFDITAASTALAACDPEDAQALEGVLELLERSRRTSDWDYEEPSDLVDILDSITGSVTLDVDTALLPDKILGAWQGRIAGCNLGKPLEMGDRWTSDRIRHYLELADAYPLRDYVPVLADVPPGYELVGDWSQCTRGNVNGSARDDDIDYAILGLHMLEEHGADLHTRQVADAWLSLLPFHQIYTAERVAYANLVANHPVSDVGSHRNPYREWIGALIRGDVYGWVNPGRPGKAIRLAYQDAALSHVANGLYGELWSAALLACAFGSDTAAEAVEASLLYIPRRSRLHAALAEVQTMHRAGLDWGAGLAEIQHDYGHYNWVHTINNAALIVAGLLWGQDDYANTVGLTVQGGWDTDSNAATAGSVAGAILGASQLPAHFIDPLRDRTRSALFGFDNSRISDLSSRTLHLARAALD